MLKLKRFYLKKTLTSKEGKMQPINLPLIKRRIEDAHSEFIDSVGQIPTKLSADHNLFLTRMRTRISSILDCFVDAKVIDEFKKIEPSNEGDNHFSVFKLSKKGFDRAVYVWTDGFNIVIRSAYNPLSLILEKNVVINNIDFDEYNWIEFSDKLLHFVHGLIYKRQKSIETKIFKV
jgi:hypothetical protein